MKETRASERVISRRLSLGCVCSADRRRLEGATAREGKEGTCSCHAKLETSDKLQDLAIFFGTGALISSSNRSGCKVDRVNWWQVKAEMEGARTTDRTQPRQSYHSATTKPIFNPERPKAEVPNAKKTERTTQPTILLRRSVCLRSLRRTSYYHKPQTHNDITTHTANTRPATLTNCLSEANVEPPIAELHNHRSPTPPPTLTPTHHLSHPRSQHHRHIPFSTPPPRKQWRSRVPLPPRRSTLA